jgi:hypothetical protein
MAGPKKYEKATDIDAIPGTTSTTKLTMIYFYR